MPTQSTSIKQGDLEPDFITQLYEANADRTPLPLNAHATAVRLYMREPRTGKTVERTGEILDPELVNPETGEAYGDGCVRVVWEEGDTDHPGRFQAVIVVTWTGGREQSVPSKGYYEIVIERR